MITHIGDDLRPKDDGSTESTGDDFGSRSLAWTEGLPKTSHIEKFKHFDWDANGLGSLANWELALRCHVSMLFADGRPGCIFWGSDRIRVPNEAYSSYNGEQKDFMGVSLKRGDLEHDNEVENLLSKAVKTSQAVDVSGTAFMHQLKPSEGTQLKARLIPLRDDRARFEGFYKTICDTEARSTSEDHSLDGEGPLHLMAKHAPLGMCQTTPDNKLAWANEQFYEIFEHDRADTEISSVLDKLLAHDRDLATSDLEKLMQGSERIVREFQLQRKWPAPTTPTDQEDSDQDATSRWILTSSFPLIEDGKVKLIMGFITDISHQKWAESVQSRNAEAAILAKRRQEEFIDTTSHEMRNPLSAITQLADGIRSSLEDVEDSKEGYRAAVDSNIEAANTILACGSHQRRVIDDVLTLSRLESNMFTITPVAERPITVVTNTIKMFSTESSMEGIEIEALEDRSYRNAEIDYVLLDPSRLTQILINLLSNAIKFTSSRPKRRISVVYGAQKHRPPIITTMFGGLDWIGTHNKDSLALPTAAEGSVKLYLYFCVQDTGRGMTEDQQNRLFQRFSQARPKTDIAYGGTGLGLYICRQLTEKQGGGIGVASRSGEGSVFGFYIETISATESDLSEEQKQASPAPPAKSANKRPEMPQRSSSAPAHPQPWRSTSDTHNRTHLSPTSSSTTEGIRDADGTSREDDDLQLQTVSPLHTPDVDGSKQIEANPPRPRRPELLSSRTLLSQYDDFHILLVEDNLVNQKILAKQLRKAKCTVTVANHGKEALEVLEKADCWRSTDEQGEEALKIDVILMDWVSLSL